MPTRKIKELGHEVDRLLNEKPIDNSQYYSFSLFADKNGVFQYGFMSHWVGWADEACKIEIREPSLINPKETLTLYEKANQPAFVINNKSDLIIYLSFLGGNSIIVKEVADEYLSHVLKPAESVFTYENGFVEKSSIAEEAFNRAPNSKMRMRVLNRDNRRCKICGASPKNNEHVELHLHHIIPYSKGGLTTENNLITLCHTCHKGLEVHLDYSLYDEIDIGLYSKRIAKESYSDRIKQNIKFSIERLEKKKLKNNLNRK